VSGSSGGYWDSLRVIPILRAGRSVLGYFTALLCCIQFYSTCHLDTTHNTCQHLTLLRSCTALGEGVQRTTSVMIIVVMWGRKCYT
jgi:hypothetical protein